MQYISLKLKFLNYEMWIFTVDFKRLVNPQASLWTLVTLKAKKNNSFNRTLAQFAPTILK